MFCICQNHEECEFAGLELQDATRRELEKAKEANPSFAVARREEGKHRNFSGEPGGS